MTYEIIFSDKSLRQLKKLEKDAQERIIKVLEGMISLEEVLSITRKY